jgi:hypothetical protein
MTALDRRYFIRIAAALVPLLAAGGAAGQTPPRLLLVHGRSQGGRTEDELLAEWTGAFRAGAEAAGVPIPGDLDMVLPFYGDKLDEVVARFNLPLRDEITTRGDAVQDDYMAFQAEIAEEMRQAAGVTDEEIDEAYGDNPRARAPWNWEWVQAIFKAIDKKRPGVIEGVLESFMRDVYIYLNSSGARGLIDSIVTDRLDSRPTIAVAHSLGTVVMYNILREESDLDVPLFVTLGSPLGIGAVKRRFRPLKFPASVGRWINAFDERDVVALNALDATVFPVSPEIANITDIRNQTGNRHGIAGYLDKASVVEPVLRSF